MSQFAREDSQAAIDLVSDGDVVLESDRNQDGVGDLVFRTAGVERARIKHDGTGTGWGGVLGGSLPAANIVIAASDTEASLVGFANLVCDGIADDVQINAAIADAAAASSAANSPGYLIILLPGTYHLAAAVDFSPLASVADCPIVFDAEAAIFRAAANMTSMFVIGYLGVASSWLRSRLEVNLGTIDGGKGAYTVTQAVYMTRLEDNKVTVREIQNVSGNGVTVDQSASLSGYMGTFNNLIEIGRIYNTDTGFSVLTSTNVYQFQANLVRLGDVESCANGIVVGSATNDYSYWNHFDVGSVGGSTGNGIQDKCGRNVWNVGCTNGNGGYGITCPVGLTFRSTFILGSIDDSVSSVAATQNLIVAGGEVVSSLLNVGNGAADPEIRFHSGATRTSWDTRIYSDAGDGSDGHGNLHIAAGLVALDTGPISTNATLESTGAGSASLGANSPASTLSAPYKWLKFHTSDGSTVYVPAWK